MPTSEAVSLRDTLGHSGLNMQTSLEVITDMQTLKASRGKADKTCYFALPETWHEPV